MCHPTPCHATSDILECVIHLLAKLHPGLCILQIDTRKLAIQDSTISHQGTFLDERMLDDRMMDDRMSDDGMTSFRMFDVRFQDAAVAL